MKDELAKMDLLNDKMYDMSKILGEIGELIPQKPELYKKLAEISYLLGNFGVSLSLSYMDGASDTPN